MNATSFIRLMSLAIGQTLTSRTRSSSPTSTTRPMSEPGSLARLGAKFRWWHMRADGCLHADDLAPLLTPRTRLVACALTSNALGAFSMRARPRT